MPRAGTIYGWRNAVISKTVPVGATQTFNPGDWLTLTSGAAAIAVAAGNNVAGGTLLLGRSGTPTVSSVPPSSGGLSDTSITFIVPTDDSEFQFTLYSGTPASAYIAPITHTGQSYGMRNDSTYGWCVNIDETTDDKLRITGFYLNDIPTYPAATTAGSASNGATQYPSVWAKVLAAQSVLSSARAAT